MKRNGNNYNMNGMTKPGKFALTAALVLALAALVFCCARFGTTRAEKAASAEDALLSAARLADAAEEACQSGNVKRILLSNAGGAVTVSAPGVYLVSGSLTEGQLTVDCKGDVTLILENAEIAHASDAAIRVQNAEHTLLYLPAGTESRLQSGTEQEITAADGENDASGAALYARDDLSIAGSGKLTVCGYINNAIATTNHLTVLGGELTLKAANNGLKGKDSVLAAGGVIDITGGNDGIKSGDGEGNGSIDIRGGIIRIVSLGDGMEAEQCLTVSDGSITVSAGDTASIRAGALPQPGEAPQGTPPEMPSANGKPPQGMAPEIPGTNGEAPQGTPPEMPSANGEPPQGTVPPDRGGQRGGSDRPMEPQGDARGFGGGRGGFQFDRKDTEKTDSGLSTKGLKSGGDLTVSGGSITVTSEDDCIHANGSVTVTGGTLLLSSGDDGIHADETLTVSGGSVTVSQSYEGLEGHFIYLRGGALSVTASDDGINACGGDADPFGRPFGQTETDASDLPLLEISGGTLSVNANGDGLDSNGNLIVAGGVVTVDGPTNGGNGALDSGAENGGRILCNGGTVLAIGSSGMAETFSGDSAQCSFIHTFSETLPAGTQITVSDESGKTLFEHVSAKTFDSIVFSSPELVLGTACTVTAGDQTDTITLESVSNGASSDFAMPGSFGGHGRR